MQTFTDANRMGLGGRSPMTMSDKLKRLAKAQLHICAITAKASKHK